MEALVSIIAGAFALYVGYRRIAYVGALFNRRKKLARAEHSIRDALDLANGPSRWRPTRGSDTEAVALLKGVAADERALEQLGFKLLGDLLAELSSEVAVMRAFAKGPTGVGLVLSTHSPKRVQLAINSYAASDCFRTIRGDGPSFATPPFIHVQHMPDDQAVAEIVAKHEAFANAAGLRTFATLDDALASIRETRERERRWRDAQPPDDLLQADLRGLLGGNYERTAAYWTRRLRAKLPDASLRRR